MDGGCEVAESFDWGLMTDLGSPPHGEIRFGPRSAFAHIRLGTSVFSTFSNKWPFGLDAYAF